MQHKFLFAALLCGAMALTGCLKNEESDSVENVRNAKANELNASADLLKAQASAETVRANAEATLAAAQAKREEAEAARAAAEAEWQKIDNQLHEIDVKLAQVQLEGDKKQLEVLKAQLEVQLKQAEIQLKQAEAALENLAKQLEIQAMNLEAQYYQAQQDLITAQMALEAFMNGLDEEQAEADLAYIQGIANQYFALQQQILAWRQQLYAKQIELAEKDIEIEDEMDAALEDLNDLYEQQADAEAELARKEYLAQWITETYPDVMTQEEIADAQNALYPTLSEAYTLFNEYQQAYLDAMDATVAAEDAVEDTYFYELIYHDATYYLEDDLGLDPHDWAQWAALQAGYTVEVDGNSFGYYDPADGEFKPVFVDAEDDGELYFIEDETLELVSQNEALAEWCDKGIFIPANWTWKWLAYIVGATINVENYEKLMNDGVYAFNEAGRMYIEGKKADKEAAADLLADIETFYQDQIDQNNLYLAEYKAYVEGAKAEYEAADAAIEAAQADVDAADAAFVAAGGASEIAKVNDVEVRKALMALDQANQVVIDLQAERATIETDKVDNLLPDYVAAETAFFGEYGAAEEAEAIFNADLREADRKGDVKTAEAGLTDAIKNNYTTAQTDSATKKAALDAAKATAATKKAAWDAAKIAAAADPADAAKAAAEATAKGEYDTAAADVITKEGEFTTADATCTTARIAYQNALDQIEIAKQNLVNEQELRETLQTAYKDAKAAVTDADTALDDKDAEIAAAQLVADAALEDYNAALGAYDGKVNDDLNAAITAQTDANNALIAAQNAKTNLDNYFDNAPDFKYSTYTIYINDEKDEDGNYVEPLSIAAQNAELAEKKEAHVWDFDGDTVDESYEDYIAALDLAIEVQEEANAAIEADAAERVDAVKQSVEEFKPAYDAAIEAYNQALEDEANAEYAYLLAQQYLNTCIDEYNAVGLLLFYDENGNEVGVANYLEALEQEIENLETQIAQLERAQDDVINFFNNHTLEDWYNECEILEAQIAELEKKIAVYSVFAEYYENLLNEWYAAHVSE